MPFPRQLKDKEQRIIISGDADCISNTELTLSREGYRSGNFNLIIESFRWLSGGEFPIDIRRPHCTDNKLSIGGERYWYNENYFHNHYTSYPLTYRSWHLVFPQKKLIREKDELKTYT